jgi:type IV pilus assembly protein PilA
LAAIAIPAYQDYTIRAKVTEGLNLADSAKTAVAESWQSGGVVGLKAAATSWNSSFVSAGKTKYVSNIVVSTTTGSITVSYNATAIPQLGSNINLVLTPYIATVALGTANTLSGNIDWACTSAGSSTATAQSLAAGNATNGVQTKFVPTNCK